MRIETNGTGYLSVMLLTAGVSVLFGCESSSSEADDNVDISTKEADSESIVCESNEETVFVGDPMWVSNFTTTDSVFVNGITHDAENNVVVAGTFKEAFCIDEKPIVAQGSRDVFVAKIDADGNRQWTRFFHGNGYKEVSDVVADSNGNTFVTGYYVDSIDIGDNQFSSSEWGTSFVAKLDPLGNVIWSKSIGHDGPSRTTALALDSVDSLYVAGFFDGVVDFGNGEVIPPVPSDEVGTILYFAKYSADGNVEFVTHFGETVHLYFSTSPGMIDNFLIQIDSLDQPVIIVRASDEDLDFGGGTINSLSSFVVVRFDPMGKFVSNSIIASPVGFEGELRLSDFSMTPSDGLVITGSFLGDVKFEGVPTTTPGSAQSVILCAIDSADQLEWVKVFGGDDPQSGVATVVNSLGMIYLSGRFFDNLNLGGYPSERPRLDKRRI